MSRKRYYHDSQNKKYKVRIKRILPFSYKYRQNWHKWIRFPIPKRVSIVFTPDYLLFKRYNKKIIEIPYDDISRWGDHTGRYWNFTWHLSLNTKIYKSENRIRAYFDLYKSCIVYLYPLSEVVRMEFNNNMNYYKTGGHLGHLRKPKAIRRRFTV